MKYILRKYLIIVFSLFTLTQIISGISIRGGWKTFLYAGLLFSALTYIVKPVVNLVLLPFNLLTLNMISWVVNIITFIIWTLLISEVKVTAWAFPGIHMGVVSLSPNTIDKFYMYIIGGIILTLTVQFYSWLFQ